MLKKRLTRLEQAKHAAQKMDRRMIDRWLLHVAKDPRYSEFQPGLPTPEWMRNEWQKMHGFDIDSAELFSQKVVEPRNAKRIGNYWEWTETKDGKEVSRIAYVCMAAAPKAEVIGGRVQYPPRLVGMELSLCRDWTKP